MAIAPSHFGSGKFGAGKFSQGSAVVTLGRAYGTGPYGTGRYGVGSGANFEIAAQSSIAFSLRLSPSGIYGVGAATGIRLLPQATAARIWSPAAASQIQFSLKWAGANVIHMVTAATQIAFSVRGELVKTWQDPGPCFVPCEAGTWAQTFPPWVVREAA